MYAVIATGGKQYRVKKGDRVKVEKLEVEEGSSLDFDVLMIGGDSPKVGAPHVAGAKVSAKVLAQGKGPKLLSFKKWKFGAPHKKLRGHRQLLTELEITGIEA